MKRTICFYCFIFLLSFCIFACIFPFPVLSRYTNLTEKQMSKINNFKETETAQTHQFENKLLDISWNEGINILLEENHPYEIYDFKTNQTFNVIRIGGSNHADIIPATDADFEFINQNFSQKEPTPVVLLYNSSTLIPASISVYMHGYSDTNNTYFGHYCLHFKSSTTDETQNTDYYHQKAIKTARKQAVKLLSE